MADVTTSFYDRVGGAPTFKALVDRFYEGVANDPVKAVTLYMRACDLASADACAALGQIYEEGRGVPPDAGRAAAFRKRACSHGDASSCAK